MKVYIVWDNDDYGSLMHPSRDEIDSIWLSEIKARWRCESLNKPKKKWMTKARVQVMEARP